MTTWTTFNGDDEAWDNVIERLGMRSPFATSGWARSKATSRWTVCRTMGVVDDRIVAAAQVFSLKLFNQITIGWIPGGVSSAEDQDFSGLTSWFVEATGSRAAYLRAAFHQPKRDEDEERLLSYGWSRCPTFIGAHETFIVRRLSGRLANPSRLTSNWKRNLERGVKRDQVATLWAVPNATEIGNLLREMAQFKKSKGPDAVSSVQMVEQLLSAMRERLIVVQVRDPIGTLQAVRGAFIVGDHAWDALAAAGVDARKTYSSYVCAWKLLEELDNRGVTALDLAGIDPKNNEGVFNFKKGLGGEQSIYLGEWDWGTSGLAQRLSRIAISRLG